MKTTDMATSVVYAHARSKYSSETPVLMIDSRIMSKWSGARFSSRSSTKICLGKQSFSVDTTGPLFLDLDEFIDHDSGEPRFRDWNGPVIEHPAVARALEQTATFREGIADLDERRVTEYVHGTWPRGVEVFRPQSILGPWETVLQQKEAERVRLLEDQEAEQNRRDAATAEFQDARNTFGSNSLSVDLSWDRRTVTMPLSSFVAIAAFVKENKS